MNDMTFRAIRSLRPTGEFILVGSKVEDIEWTTPGIAPLTTAEVEAEVTRLQAVAAQAEADALAAREAALAKLAALGLTVDDLAALGL